jgi:glucan phosphoethanolaminetransferase (alkaline phosphatase superfamily)
LKKLNKQYLYLAVVILLFSLPNITLFLIGEDSIVASKIKKIVFLAFSLSIIILPLLFLKPKYYTWLSILLSPLLLFEVYNVYTFKAPSSIEAVASIFYTNAYEGKELFKSNLAFGVLFILYLGALIYFSTKLKSTFSLNIKQKTLLTAFSLFIFTGLFIRDYKIINDLQKEETILYKLNGATSLMRTKIIKTFPSGLFYKIRDVKKGIKSIKKYKTTIKDFKFKARKKDSLNQQEIYVLVIGETARKANFSLLGYQRNTNPLLGKKDNIIAFNNVKSAANLTSISLPFLVTRATPNNINPRYNEPAVINAFKEAGFKTYWITNQATGLDNVFAFYSRLADYYKNIAISIDVAKYDKDLIPELEIVLNDKTTTKKFIIIHTIGSHFRYNFRYPDSFEKFKPSLDKSLSLAGNSVKLKTEMINSYDNSILYTDYILSEFTKQLEKLNAISYMYYVSDHGENLYDDERELLTHGYSNPTKYVMNIPIITWNSDLYKNQYPEKVKQLYKNRTAKISSNYTFQTLLDMANISFPEEKLNLSFANEAFEENNRRYLLTPNQKIIEID